MNLNSNDTIVEEQMNANNIPSPKISSASFLFPLYSQRNEVFHKARVYSRTNKIEYYRTDGIRMNFDPYAPGFAEKYGAPGKTDPDGFDPYTNKVGPGIYGGNVQKDKNGEIITGKQYQNHNNRPGPVYAGSGYNEMSFAIQNEDMDKVKDLLEKNPKIKNEITTGGARPLHVCGMSRKGQLSTQILIDAGADLHALDTYNYNALHRMASNNLEIGGEALVKAGLNPNHKPPGVDSSPIDIAKRCRAAKFLLAMQKLGHYKP